jgi:hypothetical protein
MPKERERTVEVDTDNGKVKIVVRKPSNRVTSNAQRVGALTWTQCIQDGVMTKQELDKFMQDKGIWGQDKEKEQEDTVEKLQKLEKDLYLGGGRGKTMKLSEAKEKALDMRRTRADLRGLLSEKIALENNTAESLSENSKFDYMVAHCTFYENGEQVYPSLEDYEKNSDDDIAFSAASALAELMYAVNKDFEEKLPENRFLSKFKMVNEDLSLVNAEGITVDTTGKRIDDEGKYLDRDGNRVDVDGLPLDEDGNYISPLTYVDDLGLGIDKKEKPSKEDVAVAEQKIEDAVAEDQPLEEEKPEEDAN